MLKVTAQGTMINFPNAKCRLTMKNECVFMVFFPSRDTFCYQNSLQILNYSPSVCSLSDCKEAILQRLIS